MPKVTVTRRELIASAGALAASTAAVPDVWAKPLLAKRARVGPGAFPDGVASGEPGPTAVTFWSRLETPRPRSGARLVVATDPGMRKVVATTVVPTGAGLNGTLKARVGGLQPGTQYWYAWESGTDVSPIGRTRTAPPVGADARPRRRAELVDVVAEEHVEVEVGQRRRVGVRAEEAGRVLLAGGEGDLERVDRARRRGGPGAADR